MVIIRCTHRLRRYLTADAAAANFDASTTRLGDWYANLMFTKHRRLTLCVSERSLLPVFVPLKNRSEFLSRLHTTLGQILSTFGVQPDAIERELGKMNPYGIDSTINRSVLGSLNELSFQARGVLEQRPEIEPLNLALEIAETPCSMLKYETPRSATLALFR